jgi:hypothetical protein
MKYSGVDVHKRYCVATTQDEQGRRLGKRRIEGDLAAGFVQWFKAQGGPCRVAIEACWNWGFVYDILEQIPEVEEIVVSNPLMETGGRQIGTLCQELSTDPFLPDRWNAGLDSRRSLSHLQ